MEEAQPIWKSQVVIAVLIVLFFPLGLFLMWRYAPWRSVFKWLWTILVLLIFVTVFVRPPSDEPDNSSGYVTPVDALPTAFL
jgi:glucan phosphoethanolaminetransferase (alkaline phosphatase superfamily)